jgi:hypothetical protein
MTHPGVGAGGGAMSTIQVKRWTREEYDRMIDAGIFAA